MIKHVLQFKFNYAIHNSIEIYSITTKSSSMSGLAFSDHGVLLQCVQSVTHFYTTVVNTDHG